MLIRLEALLKEPENVALTQAVVGLGGIGKTQIAVEFCHRNKDAYPAGVFWAEAESAASLDASYAEFALDLGWATRGTPVDDAAEIWRKRASQMSGWLLVLDNADEPDEIRERLPRTTSGHVLVTSRIRNPGLGGRPLPVDVWPLEEAESFLADRTGREEEADAYRDLWEALGGLPLALEQAAAYLVQHPTLSIETYLDGFRRRLVAFMEKPGRRGPTLGDSEKTVAKTWAISFEKLPEAASETLRMLAFLDADGIPIRFFEACAGIDSVLGSLDLSDPFVVEEEILEPLRRYSCT